MSYLLDTTVISETVRQNANKAVLSWLDQVPGEGLFLSVLTLGEIRKGVESLKDGNRKERLRIWLEHDLPEWFNDRLLGVNGSVADRWGRLLAEMQRPVPAIDSLLAATALHYDLRLVTRNSADFAYPGLEVFNPWNAQK